MKKFFIIDGNALMHRVWHAIPPLTTKKGVIVNAAYGFINIFLKIIKEQKPDYICATFDLRKKTFRHNKYPLYKAGRKKQPDEFYNQFFIVKEVLKAFNVPIYEKERFEADDVIGTITDMVRNNKNLETFVVTGDLDTLQLVDKQTKIFTFKKGINDIKIYDQAAIMDRFGITAEQVIDYKSLRGDASDNIPGVPGVGEKTASKLISQFNDLDNLYKLLDSSDLKESLKNRLKENKDSAYLSKDLATIIRNVDIDFKLEENEWDFSDYQKIYELFHEYEFRSLLNKVPTVDSFYFKTEVKQKVIKKQYKLIDNVADFNVFYQKLIQKEEVCLDTETTSLNVYQAELLGISFCFKSGEAYYVVAQKDFLKKLKPIIEKIKVIGHNLKYDYKILKLTAGIELQEIYFDTLIAAYLLTKINRSLKLDDLAFSELGYRMQSIEELIGKSGKDQLNMRDINIAKVSDYSCEDADCTFRLYKQYQKELKDEKLLDLFAKLEMPLVKILADMEINGIKVDIKYLEKLKEIFQFRIEELTKEIHELGGREFNVNSTKQLKEILFDELEISTKGIKKTKTGFSTAASELEKMQDRHPIIDLIFEYRELAKLQSTYVIGLLKDVDQSSRIHTVFNQSVTATGRLSSSGPNLQNIPIRTDLGKKIRLAFVPEKGNILIAADYSQIELRVVASLSGDKKMIDSFRKGEDIHKRTAAEVNGKRVEEVTKGERRNAKEVNFGVIYGLGARGLSKRTALDYEEAQNFIDQYFILYSGVKKYLDGVKAFAHKYEYVQTLFGRKRYIKEINSGMHMIKAAAERTAINMPVQGTAADLMKMAMIKLSREMPNIKMLVQVHDEIVFEVSKKNVEKVSVQIKEIMEGVYDKLKVPIKIDLESGNNWGECK